MGYLEQLRDQGLAIRSRAEWGAARSYTDPRAVDMPARWLILHVSVTSRRGSWQERMRVIERIGISRFPNTGISYNAAAFEDGLIADGQPLTRRGAHTVNDRNRAGFPHNVNYAGRAIVIPGMGTEPVPDAQVRAIAAWGAAQVRADLSVATRFYGHRDFAYKACPGDPAYRRLDDVNDLFRDYVRDGLPSRPTPTPKDWFDMATKADLQAAIREMLPDIARAVWDQQVANTLTPDPGDLTYLRNLIQDAAATGRLDAAASRDIAARLERLEAALAGRAS